MSALLADSPITSEAVISDIRQLLSSNEDRLAFATLCLSIYEDSLPLTRQYHAKLVILAAEMGTSRAARRLDELLCDELHRREPSVCDHGGCPACAAGLWWVPVVDSTRTARGCRVVVERAQTADGPAQRHRHQKRLRSGSGGFGGEGFATRPVPVCLGVRRLSCEGRGAACQRRTAMSRSLCR
ncbi:MafI family immunity protein [Streptomyces zhihengii]|uniref:MafI family immunity protein n=1 Tax=Streptomyces zhihengii TaxID=1818004 RepID=UPI0033A57D51